MDMYGVSGLLGADSERPLWSPSMIKAPGIILTFAYKLLPMKNEWLNLHFWLVNQSTSQGKVTLFNTVEL